MISIFVGNLGFRISQDELQTAFSQYGNVERVNIVTDRESGQPRGFAFIEMTERGEAENAIRQLNGAELNGCTMTVNEARPRLETQPSGFASNRQPAAQNRGLRLRLRW